MRDAGTPPRVCGSACDAVTGRAGWPQWQAADLSDPAAAHSSQIVRTLRCPGTYVLATYPSDVQALYA